MHVPTVTKASTPPLVIVQTPEVDDVKETVNAELDVAVSVGVVPKFCATGFAKVIDWESFGVTLDEATEAPDKPTLFVAVTVKVYAVPFVKPVTMIGLVAPLAVNPPGLDVTV